MKTPWLTGLIALSLCLTPLQRPAAAEEVVIKLGTLAPTGSTWHTLIKEMGQKWKEASGGRVTLRIYPGGVVGNEGDMVKKMRIGQLQAAALTTIGLHDISPEPQAIDVPMMIDSYPTLDYVREKIGPKLERAVALKGYVVMNWSEVGYVRFFSTKRYSLAELQANGKMFCWEGDPASADACAVLALQILDAPVEGIQSEPRVTARNSGGIEADIHALIPADCGCHIDERLRRMTDGAKPRLNNQKPHLNNKLI